MKIIQELESILFEGQDSFNVAESREDLDNYLHIIRSYAEVEGAIVVLSDLINSKSYICVGMLGLQFGLESDVSRFTEIESIWEDEIYNKIDADDLFQKYILELKYCHFLNKKSVEDKSRYCTDSRVRMLNIEGQYQYVNHQTIYHYDSLGDSLMFGVCVYKSSLNQGTIEGINGRILDKQRGVTIEYREYNDCSDLLSVREKEVLSCIEKGLLSKEIAEALQISQNTVNRHRQNILQKIGVNNSFEAVRIAKAMDLL